MSIHMIDVMDNGRTIIACVFAVCVCVCVQHTWVGSDKMVVMFADQISECLE